jgi:hypothetical protein
VQGQRRGRRRLVTGLAVLALAVPGGCDRGPADPPRGTSASRSSTTSTTSTTTASTTTREAALAELLAARAAAVRHRDRAAFSATLDDPGSGFGLRQLAQFDALARLSLGGFSYGIPEPAPALGADRVAQLGPEAWVSRVRGTWSLAGFDTAPREFESFFSVVRRGTRWRLADDTDGGTQPQAWDLPRFTVVRDGPVLVMGSGPVSRLRPYLALGEQAVADVRDVWTPEWAGRLVLVVPGTAAQMAEQVGHETSNVAQVAAITDGPFGLDGRAGADRIVVNPTAFAGLEPKGRQVVLSHEATHVAIRATTTGSVPMWLSEGMADYIGYRGVDVPRAVVAEALLDRVRAGTGPRALPGPGDFDPSRSTIAPSYNAAWLAVHRIAERFGEERLVRFYRAAASATDGGAGTDPEAATSAAFESVLGTSEEAFTREWLRSLDRLAGA